ncbi:hypothetical protein pipiens_016682 [Culex pipiens pipiens]|uniref:Uncharacterized protein n=1 Tax=Culex pipiens pipiens TaxID=38569 RepID=A0ABD1CK81_CULPP
MATNTTTVDDKNNNKQFPQSPYVQGCQSSIDGRIGENSMTLDIAVRMLMMQFTEMKLMLETFRNDFNRKIDTIKSELQGKDATLGQIKHRVNRLHLNIDAFENQKELIISGVPFASDEDPDALFATICRQLECSGGEELLTSTRRIHVNRLMDGDVSPLLVEFALKTTRDRFYSTYLRRRDLKLRHLGMPSDRRVFINENLNAGAREVKKAALLLKKVGKLTFVFTKGGIVHVKRRVGDPPTAVQSVKDLDDV